MTAWHVARVVLLALQQLAEIVFLFVGITAVYCDKRGEVSADSS